MHELIEFDKEFRNRYGENSFLFLSSQSGTEWDATIEETLEALEYADIIRRILNEQEKEGNK